MKCTTVKEGMECIFMQPKGCTFNGGACHPVIDKCNGCARIMELPSGNYCQVFPDPAAKWANGNTCSMATHLRNVSRGSRAHMVNPLKASKRLAKGKKV